MLAPSQAPTPESGQPISQNAKGLASKQPADASQNKGLDSFALGMSWSYLFTENEGHLRRSVRPLKGKGGLERLQTMSDTVSQHTTKKRKGGPLEDLPEGTLPNPMAPSQSKPKRRRMDKVMMIHL